MKRIATVLAVAALSTFGCKKKEEAKPAEPAADTATKPAEPAAAPAAAPADPAAAPADPAAAAAAPAGDDTSTGIAECDDLVKRYSSCEKLPAEAKAQFMEGAKAWKAGAAAGPDQKKAITDACKQAATSADASMKAMGC